MDEVGVKALKDHLSEYLRRAHAGERILITDRGAPLAVLVPVEESAAVRFGWDLVRSGAASWQGGKPRGSARPAAAKGRLASDVVLEDRR
jgi:prevent-host-death family protein